MQDQGTGTISSITTDYYNSLILGQADNYENKAKIGERIANIEDKINGFKNSGSTSSQKSYVEEELIKLTTICETLYDLTERHADEIINSEFYKNSYIESVGAQYLASSFMSSANIKKAVIGLVIGIVAGVIIWAVDGLCTELKKGSAENRKKNEKEATA